MPDSHKQRLIRARASLEGLSVGDAFGERFFGQRDLVSQHIRERRLPEPVWHWTDDTSMAISIYAELARNQGIDQDVLAGSFARHFSHNRGYGFGARRLLMNIQEGGRWQDEARSLFGGMGSFGNGGAMRIAPLGAYFADDLDAAVTQARISAEVTHAHPEGIAGAVAVAAAAALAWQARGGDLPSRAEFIDRVLPHIPESTVRDRCVRARDMSSRDPIHAAEMLGSGLEVSAQDTVPFVLWCAGEYLGSYEDALWATVSGLGDRDTTCAMVGGIVVMATDAEAIPPGWVARREPLPVSIE